MEMRQPERRFKAFFKVYLPTSAERIIIPSAYVSDMKGKIPQRAFLRHGDGKVWQMEVKQIGHDLFFNDGWGKYVQDNSLELGDFLVFHYDGQRFYNIKLFRMDGSQKNEAGTIKEETKQTKHVNEAVEEEGVEDGIREEEVEKLKKTAIHKRSAHADANSSRRNLKKKLKGEKLEAKADKGKHKKISADTYGDNIFKSGLIPKPKNPYFITSIRRRRKNELYVPVDFIEDHNLILPSKISLHDHNDRKWSSNLKTWKDGRIWYYGGWARLCKSNRVAEKDICMCELKKGTDGVLFFQVHIVPEDMMLKIRSQK